MNLPDNAFVMLNSSALARVAYDDRRQQLHVKFHDGSVYVYLGVTSTVYDELLNADSQGGYFNRRIRNVYLSKDESVLG